MEYDRLKLLNTKLLKSIVAMNDDEVWSFLLENEARVKRLTQSEVEPKLHLTSGYFYAYPHGIDWFKKHFLQHIENYREGVIYTLVLDFCFSDEAVKLDYWARCGYFDNADSCRVKTSDSIMPPVDEDSEEGCYRTFFHLLELQHVENIIQSMENNFDKLTDNTQEDINKIKEMKEICLKNEDFKIIYIYQIR